MVEPVAVVQVLLMPDGQVVSQAKGCNRPTFLMMMEVAKLDMERRMYAAEQQRVKPAEPGLEIPGLRAE